MYIYKEINKCKTIPTASSSNAIKTTPKTAFFNFEFGFVFLSLFGKSRHIRSFPLSPGRCIFLTSLPALCVAKLWSSRPPMSRFDIHRIISLPLLSSSKKPGSMTERFASRKLMSLWLWPSSVTPDRNSLMSTGTSVSFSCRFEKLLLSGRYESLLSLPKVLWLIVLLSLLIMSFSSMSTSLFRCDSGSSTANLFLAASLTNEGLPCPPSAIEWVCLLSL
jgi:hypothetical protein